MECNTSFYQRESAWIVRSLRDAGSHFFRGEVFRSIIAVMGSCIVDPNTVANLPTKQTVNRKTSSRSGKIP